LWIQKKAAEQDTNLEILILVEKHHSPLQQILILFDDPFMEKHHSPLQQILILFDDPFMDGVQIDALVCTMHTSGFLVEFWAKRLF